VTRATEQSTPAHFADKKTIRSFVRRSGRTTESQSKAFEQHWPMFGLEVSACGQDIDLAFPDRRPRMLEIGFGMGDSLFEMAVDTPEYDFIGIEVHQAGVGRLLNLASKAGIDNLRVYCADGVDVLEKCIASKSLQRVQLYFPDPWPKKKHHKRRLVQPDFMSRVSDCIKTDGQFHAATDWEPYAEHMMEVLSAEPSLTNFAGPGKFCPKPAYRPATKFERRGRRLGHGVWDLVFEKI